VSAPAAPAQVTFGTPQTWSKLEAERADIVIAARYALLVGGEKPACPAIPPPGRGREQSP